MVNGKTITQRDKNSKKKSKGNARNKQTNKHKPLKQIENDFTGLIHRPNTTKERIHRLEEVLTETSQTQMQRGKKKKDKTEYLRLARQLQKVSL